jgi:glycosyltransferase
MRVGGKSNQSIRNRVKANLEDRHAWEINDLKPRFYTLYLKPLRKIFQFF